MAERRVPQDLRGPTEMQSVSEAAAAYMTAADDEDDDGGAAAARARADAARKASAAAAAAKKKRDDAARAKKAGERDAYEKLTEALEKAQPEAAAASQSQPQTQLPGYTQSQSQLSFGAGAVAAAVAEDDDEEDVDGVDVSKYVLNDASDEEGEEDDDEGEDASAAAANNLLFTSAAAAAPQASQASQASQATGKRKAPGDDCAVPPAAGAAAASAGDGDDEGAYLDDSAAAAAAATAADKAAAERQRDARRQKQQQQQQQQPDAAGGGVNYKDSTASHAGSTATAAARATAVFGAPPPPQAAAQAAAAVPAAAEEALRVYWLDAREDGYGLLGTGGNSSPGTVYVFGRLQTGPNVHDTVSCCLRVGGLQRQVFFLPRETDEETGEPLAPLAAQQEVSAFCRELGISKRRVAVVQRWYGFEEQGLPRDSRTWLKLSYPPQFRELGVTPQHASDVQRHLRTVTHAFGDGKSFLESFILKKRLKGPSWLNVAGGFRRVAKEAQMSHCAVEFEVDTYKAVSLATDWEQRPPPPLRALSLALHTELVDRSGGTGGTGGSNEVFSVSAVFYRDVDVEKPRAENGGSAAAAPYRWAGVRPANAHPARPLLPHVVDAEFARRGVAAPALLGSEGQLLAALMAEVEREDPDIIVGHNFLAYDLDVLLHRMAEHRVNTWDRLGRMRLRTMPRLQHGVGGGSESTWEERAVLGGRLVADSYLLSKEYHKATSYKLRALALELRLPYGPTSEADVTLAPIASLPDALQDPAGVLEIVLRTDTKALLSFGLVTRLQCLPLTKRLTYLAGNLWTRTLTGSRAERTEYLLLHDFYRQKYVLPDKRRRSAAAAQEGGRRPKYSGGMVLEPERGLYTDYVLLLDFNSLYPSIIQEYKVCFSTVRRDDANAETDEHGTPVVDLSCTKCRTAGGVDDDDYCPHKGILPKAIRRLVQERVRVKKAMATERDAATRGRFDVMQKALKLTANSIYGCLGFESSRFFAQSLAQVVTAQGRLALGDTVKLVNEMPEDLRVIYGDTDSVMLKTSIPNSAPIAEATRMAKCVKEQVNKKYSCLEIDIDGVFRSILLVRKKKYAAVVVNDWAAAANTRDGCGSDFSREVKGLDMVRRDWCRYTSEVQGHTLDFCLSGDEEENVRSSIIAYLKKIGEEVRSSECDINKFIITKALQKDPEAYLDPSAQPHVSVALRMRRKSKLPVKSGDYVEYIVATAADAQRVLGLEDGAADTKKVSGRAFTKDEIVANKMSIDKEWYLATQFHPPLSRLVEPFRGLESRVVAECLDIENAPGVTHPCGDDADGGGGGGGGNSSAEKYLITAAGRRTVAERFFPMELLLACRGCKREVALDTHQAVLQRLETWDDASPLCQPSAGLLRCAGCGAQHDLKRLGNQVIREVRQRQKTYFADPTGYESNYLLENTEASRRVSDRHTRDYVDMVRVLFSLQEWFQLVVGWTQVCKEEQLWKVAGTHVRSEAASIAAEKVYNLMSDLELTHFEAISVYVKSVSEKFAHNRVDVTELFGVITKFSSGRV